MFGMRKKTVPRTRPPVRKKIRSRALRELQNSASAAGALTSVKKATRKGAAFEQAARGRALGGSAVRRRSVATLKGARQSSGLHAGGAQRRTGNVSGNFSRDRPTGKAELVLARPPSPPPAAPSSSTLSEHPPSATRLVRTKPDQAYSAATFAVICAVQDIVTRVESSAASGARIAPLSTHDDTLAADEQLERLRNSNEALRAELSARGAFFDAELDALRESAAEAEEMHARELSEAQQQQRQQRQAMLSREQQEHREQYGRIKEAASAREELLRRSVNIAEMALEDLSSRMHLLETRLPSTRAR